MKQFSVIFATEESGFECWERKFKAEDEAKAYFDAIKKENFVGDEDIEVSENGIYQHCVTEQDYEVVCYIGTEPKDVKEEIKDLRKEFMSNF